MTKTILIEPQADRDSLAAAVNAALSEEFGVSPDDNGVIAPFPDSKIGFYSSAPAASGSNVYLFLKNDQGINASANTVLFATDTYFALDIYYSKQKTAVSAAFRKYESPVLPLCVIVKNSIGEYTGIAFAANGNTPTYIREKANSSIATYSFPAVYTSYNPAFSMVKYPDFFAGAMFEELYLLISAPTMPVAGMIIHTDNADFVPIRSGPANASAFAIPI